MDQDDYSQYLSGDESNLAEKFRFETRIRAAKQGSRSIGELYDYMVNLWDQMAELEPKDLSNSSSYKKLQEEQQIIQFLISLRDEFDPFRKSILSRSRAPSFEEVVNELKIVERRLKSSTTKGKVAVQNNYNDASFAKKFSSLSTYADDDQVHEPTSSGGMVSNVAKFAAASLAAAGVSWAISDYLAGSEDSHSSRDSMTLKILSYNVCFWDLELHERMNAIGDLIEMHSPDFICFQEVTWNIYNIFKLSTWWKSYKSSLSFDEARGRQYFCMQLSSLPVKSFSRKPFRNSRMGRELCMAEVEVFKGNSLMVATSHLESPTPTPPSFDQLNSAERVAQANEALNILNSSSNVIFCGDMNWDDESDGKFPLLRGWSDAWAELRPWQIGWTYDTKSNQMLTANRPLQKRLDRFVCKLQDFKLEKITMVGTEAIPGVSYPKEKRVRNRTQTLKLPVLPSDHFGLLLEVHSK